MLHIKSPLHTLNLHRLTSCTLLYSSSLLLACCTPANNCLLTYSSLTVSCTLLTIYSFTCYSFTSYSLITFRFSCDSLLTALNSNSQLTLNLTAHGSRYIAVEEIRKTHITWSPLSTVVWRHNTHVAQQQSIRGQENTSRDIHSTVADVTALAPDKRTRRRHSFLYCCVMYRVHWAASWQRIDQIRYNTPSLRLLVPSSLSMHHRSFFSKGCACNVCAGLLLLRRLFSNCYRLSLLKASSPWVVHC
jgi:hypothetical protein